MSVSGTVRHLYTLAIRRRVILLVLIIASGILCAVFLSYSSELILIKSNTIGENLDYINDLISVDDRMVVISSSSKLPRTTDDRFRVSVIDSKGIVMSSQSVDLPLTSCLLMRSPREAVLIGQYEEDKSLHAIDVQTHKSIFRINPNIDYLVMRRAKDDVAIVQDYMKDSPLSMLFWENNILEMIGNTSGLVSIIPTGQSRYVAGLTLNGDVYIFDDEGVSTKIFNNIPQHSHLFALSGNDLTRGMILFENKRSLWLIDLASSDNIKKIDSHFMFARNLGGGCVSLALVQIDGLFRLVSLKPDNNDRSVFISDLDLKVTDSPFVAWNASNSNCFIVDENETSSTHAVRPGNVSAVTNERYYLFDAKLNKAVKLGGSLGRRSGIRHMSWFETRKSVAIARYDGSIDIVNIL